MGGRRPALTEANAAARSMKVGIENLPCSKFIFAPNVS
jgi:hypothetical protein